MKTLESRITLIFSIVLVLCLVVGSIYICPKMACAEEYVEDEDDEEYEEEEEEEEFDEEFDLVTNFQASKIGKNSVTLKWDKVSDIDGYEISYKKATSSKWSTIMISSSKKTKVIKKLKLNTKYSFRIRPYIYYEDEEFYEEDEEDEEDFEEVDYEDEEEDDEEEVEPYDEYVFGEYSTMSLKTLNKLGEGEKKAYSNTFEEIAHASVKAPTLTSTKSTKVKQIDLKWKKSSKATGYEIYMSKKQNSGYKKVATIKKSSIVKF